MYTLKPLSPAAILPALDKAERYRLLNEPAQAESICLDVLHTDPENQRALITLLLALTDQFSEGYQNSEARAQEVLKNIAGEYAQAYYGGIILERKAKAKLDQHLPHAKYIAYELFDKAMLLYAKAETIRPQGNDDALLRWNTCARMIMQHKLEPHDNDHPEHPLE